MQTLFLLLAVGIAGARGTMARFGIVEWVARHWLNQFPVATFTINVSGAFALGLLMSIGATAGTLRVILGTGWLFLTLSELGGL